MFGQQRSASGPGGLSINTNSANTFGANASQPPQSGGSKPLGLFGSNTTPAAPQASGLFGSSTTANQGGGLFGSQGNNNNQQAATGSNAAGGLFGAKSDNQGQQGGGLFGTQSNQQQGGLFGQQSQPQQSGGLFSNTQQPQQSGGLFGNTQPLQTQQGGGLFGSNQQATQGGGLFSNTQQQQPQQTGGLSGSSLAPQGNGSFGSIPSQQPQQPGSLFGTAGQQQLPQMGNMQSAPNLQSSRSFTNLQSSTQQPRPLFASSIGQYSREQQAAIPGVRIDLNNLRPTTRFNDLYEDIQKIIEHVDNFILNQVHLHDECEQAMPKVGQALSYIPPDVEHCTRQLELMQQALENDAAAVDHTKSLVKMDADNGKISFKAIQNLRMPQQFHNQMWNTPMPQQTAGLALTNSDLEEGSSTNLVSFFSKQADGMSKTLESYKRNIAEVEAYLKGIESSTVQQLQRVQFTKGRDGGGRSAEDQVRELTAVLREFEGGIVGVAGKVTEVREKVQERILGEGDNDGRRRGLY